jgi:hypothetical protein
MTFKPYCDLPPPPKHCEPEPPCPPVNHCPPPVCEPPPVCPPVVDCTPPTPYCPPPPTHTNNTGGDGGDGGNTGDSTNQIAGGGDAGSVTAGDGNFLSTGDGDDHGSLVNVTALNGLGGSNILSPSIGGPAVGLGAIFERDTAGDGGDGGNAYDGHVALAVDHAAMSGIDSAFDLLTSTTHLFDVPAFDVASVLDHIGHS